MINLTHYKICVGLTSFKGVSLGFAWCEKNEDMVTGFTNQIWKETDKMVHNEKTNIPDLWAQ